MSRPVTKKLKVHQLTRQQAAFASYCVNGMSPSEAAEQAGYARGHARTYDSHKVASNLLAKPHIVAAIRAGKAARAAERASLRAPLSREEVISAVDAAEQARESGASAAEVQALLRVAELKLRLLTKEPPPEAEEVRRDISVQYVESRPEPLPENQTARIPAPAEPVMGPDPHREATDAPKASETASNRHPGRRLEAAPTPNIPPCERHGAVQQLREARLGNSNARVMVPFCPQCEAEAQAAERKLSSLMPGERSWSWRN